VPAAPETLLSAYTPNNQFFLASVFVDFNYSNSMRFYRTSDASIRITYTFPSDTIVYAGEINAAGTLFTYTACPTTGCTTYIANVPAL
jgi:hypothetical protein